VIEYGFDAANAPNAGTAKMVLQDLGGSWVCVYIGGIDLAPVARKTWTPQLVREYVDVGIKKFLPIYVPLQGGSWDPEPIILDTVACMERFGWGRGVPVYLDIESPSKAYQLEPTAQWVRGMRAHGYRPGVYGPLNFLAQLAGYGSGKPDFAWFTNWIYPEIHRDLDPATMPGFDPNVYPQRAWQYTLGQHIIRGVDLDGDVSNAPMAGPPGGAVPPEDIMDEALAGWLIRDAYVACSGSEPSIEDRDIWRNEMMTNVGPPPKRWRSIEEIRVAIHDVHKAAWDGRRAAIDALIAGGSGGGGKAPHKHDGGRTGDAIY
jgi:hypothetical protein